MVALRWRVDIRFVPGWCEVNVTRAGWPLQALVIDMSSFVPTISAEQGTGKERAWGALKVGEL